MKRLVSIMVLLTAAAGFLAAQQDSGEEFYRVMERELLSYGWSQEEWEALEQELGSIEGEVMLKADPEMVAFSLELSRREMADMEEAFAEKKIEVERTMEQLQARIARQVAETSVELEEMGVDQRLAMRSAIRGARKAAGEVEEALSEVVYRGENGELTVEAEGATLQMNKNGLVLEGDFGTLKIHADENLLEINGQANWQFRETLRENIREEVGEAMAEFDERVMQEVRNQLRNMLKDVYDELDGFLSGNRS